MMLSAVGTVVALHAGELIRKISIDSILHVLPDVHPEKIVIPPVVVGHFTLFIFQYHLGIHPENFGGGLNTGTYRMWYDRLKVVHDPLMKFG